MYQRASDGRWCGAVTLGYAPDGKPDRVSFYGSTAREVREKLDEAKRTRAEGLPVRLERQTVAEFLRRWLDDYCKPNVKPKTLTYYKIHVDKHIIPGLGYLDLRKVTAQDVQWLLSEVSAKKKGPAPAEGQPDSRLLVSGFVAKACRDTLRAAFNVAIDWKMLSRNVAERVRPPRRAKKKPQVFDREQARKFKEGIEGHRLGALFLLTLCLGMRQGEVLGLRKEDVDIEGKRIYIRYALQRIEGKLQLVPTKTEESQRSAILPDVVVSAIAGHLGRQEEEKAYAGSAWKESGMLFTTRIGTMLDARNLLRDYYALRKSLDLPRIRFHDLRHSAATILHVAGVPSQAIKHLLGHSSIRTTEGVYMHSTPDAETEAAAKMDEIMKPVAVTVAVKKGVGEPS